LTVNFWHMGEIYINYSATVSFISVIAI